VIENWKETPGVGVEAIYLGQSYSIRRISESAHKNLTGFELTRDHQVLLKAYFKDQVRKEASALIRTLKQNNLEVFLLSGDRTEVVGAIAQELGLESHQYRAQLSPKEKAQFLDYALNQHNKNYLMVGDGHNDALALSKASTSIAVKGCAETSLRAADAYAQKNDLRVIISALNLSSFYHRLIQQNVGLSLTYNLIAGSLAIAGLVDPLMAAVLMPINSFVVIGATVLAQPRKKKEI
jgi:P-type E1-E2 ATPase